ncbi:hypothetical protein JYK14_10685 [Siccirubricoccus sp. KC 17139]|uniref:Uncharacterized protein n=1 Tax=Siccirubricoccus soli TaxID=2899147 RepID=A0ABT1D3X1_9PROT|nr:hypothetical protein [Siccirubricoccus soli]MCO6416623.1 hypothetical protein [Siccirubricoccus soli]MCP2682758.1 hypothetical protein [Siccirubricoccus soli]
MLPLAALAGLLALAGPEAVLALGPGGWASLTAGIFLPGCLLLLFVSTGLQRGELHSLRAALLRQGRVADQHHLALEALLAEGREHTALLREQVRLLLGGLAQGQRQAEVAEALLRETRLSRLVAEWDVTARELSVLLAGMWRLAFGWRGPAGPGGEPGAPLPLPAPEELPLALLRLLPASAEEMARFEVDERFVRQAARYRATFAAFLDQVPETGPMNRALFRDMALGRVDARLALLPRPDHGRVVPPDWLAPDSMAAE